MDEYLFITLAKLQADRLRLERQQRGEPQATPRKEPVEAHEHPARFSWFSRQPEWRRQS